MQIGIRNFGAGGGTRTHTTLPSRDFKSLASTSSATSAPFVSQGFLRFGQRMFCSKSLLFCKTSSRIFQSHRWLSTEFPWVTQKWPLMRFDLSPRPDYLRAGITNPLADETRLAAGTG